MRVQDFIRAVLVCTLAFQAVAGVVPMVCAHAEIVTATQTAGDAHAHYGAHAIDAATGTPAACDCDCPGACMAHCVHTVPLAFFDASAIIKFADIDSALPGASLAYRLPSHASPPLRPPASL